MITQERKFTWVLMFINILILLLVFVKVKSLDDSLKASPEKLVDYLQNYFPGAKIQSAYEAGFSGFHLHRYLTEHGIDNKVIHAAAIEISARDRVKTDKRDSLKIALQLAAGRLVGIYVPSVETRSVSYRHSLTGNVRQ